MKTKTKIRLASIASRLIVFLRQLSGRGHRAVINRGGIKWDLDLSEGIDFAIYLLGLFERSTVKTYTKLLSFGDTVLDIGANMGAHTLPLAHAVGPQGKVIAFEPTAYAYHKLIRNISLNPALEPRIRAEQLMLLDRDELLSCPSLYSSWGLNNIKTSRHPKHLGQLMSTNGAMGVKLDDYVARSGLKRIDFIKIDVDGNECTVLRGALQTLKAHRPKILMEFMPYGLKENGTSLEELVELLKSTEYNIFAIPGLSSLSEDPKQIGQLIADGSSINVLCLPNNNRELRT